MFSLRDYLFVQAPRLFSLSGFSHCTVTLQYYEHSLYHRYFFEFLLAYGNAGVKIEPRPSGSILGSASRSKEIS